MSDFVDVNHLKSPAWRYFRRNKEKAQAQCQKCGAILKSGTSTKALLNHLKNLHMITFDNEGNESSSTRSRNQLKSSKTDELASPSPRNLSTPEDSTRSSLPKRPRSTVMTDHFQKQKEFTLDYRVSRMCAVNLFSFNSVATSQDIRDGFRALGLNLPQSEFGIRKCIEREYSKTKAEMVEKISELKLNWTRFSYTCDEWTSTRNRRFMNLNIHFNDDYYSLGLVRVIGSMPMKKLKDLFGKRLSEFGLEWKDLVGGTTDGAPLMISFGKAIDPILHVVCYAHTINLAVCDVIKAKKAKPDAFEILDQENDDYDDIEDNSETSDNEILDQDIDSDDENDGLNFENEVEQDDELIPDINEVIIKMRKVVKLFKYSPVNK